MTLQHPYPSGYEALLTTMAAFSDKEPVPWSRSNGEIFAPLRGDVLVVMLYEVNSIAVQIFRNGVPLSPIRDFGENQTAELKSFLNEHRV